MSDQSDEKQISNNWKKLQILSNSISIILIPIVIALAAHLVNSSISSQELALKYVQLAVNLLEDEPREETKNLRKWAISLIDHYSEVDLPDEAAEELEFEVFPEHLLSKALTGHDYPRPPEIVAKRDNGPLIVKVAHGNEHSYDVYLEFLQNDLPTDDGYRTRGWDGTQLLIPVSDLLTASSNFVQGIVEIQRVESNPNYRFEFVFEQSGVEIGRQRFEGKFSNQTKKIFPVTRIKLK